MPIKGLSDRAATFPKLGTLRKGAPKEASRPGVDLSYFRFDTDDKQLEELFALSYGKEPRLINAFLPFKTTEQNFQSWMEEWANSSLLRRCDGEFQHIWLNDDKKSYSKGRKACLECDGKTGCKPSGKLHIIIPELKRLGYIEVQTHAKWDIMGLTENLIAVEQAAGDLRGIPFQLTRRLRNISTPRENGRARVDKWLLAIEVAPQWSSKIVEAISVRADAALLPQKVVAALPAATQTIEVGAVAEELICATNVELNRLGWDSQLGRDYLLQTYGKHSRQLLSEDELLDFLSRLQAMEPEVIDGDEYDHESASPTVY